MAAVDQWWSGLTEPARDDVLQLWGNACENGPCHVKVSAVFIDDEERPQTGQDLWHDDFYEYLVNHEEYLLRVPGPHVCTAQPAAEAAVRAGFIPASFTCPIANSDCLMHKLLARAPGQSVSLQLTFEPSR